MPNGRFCQCKKNPTRCFHYVVVYPVPWLDIPGAGSYFCVPWGVTLHANCRIFPDSQVTKPSKKHELYKMWLMADNARHTIMCPHSKWFYCTVPGDIYVRQKEIHVWNITKKINFISVLLQRIKKPSPLFMYLVHLRLAGKVVSSWVVFGVHMFCFLTQWFHPRCAW